MNTAPLWKHANGWNDIDAEKHQIFPCLYGAVCPRIISNLAYLKTLAGRLYEPPCLRAYPVERVEFSLPATILRTSVGSIARLGYGLGSDRVGKPDQPGNRPRRQLS